MSNRSFGGSNLMVATCRALAHGYLLTKKNTYGAFNPKDFSIPGSYTTEERLQAEKIFKYQSQLEPSKYGEITRSPQGDQFERQPPSPPHAIPSSSQNPIQPSSPISLDIPPPPPSFRALMSKPILEQCVEIDKLADELKLGYSTQPLLSAEQHKEGPLELIEQ